LPGTRQARSSVPFCPIAPVLRTQSRPHSRLGPPGPSAGPLEATTAQRQAPRSSQQTWWLQPCSDLCCAQSNWRCTEGPRWPGWAPLHAPWWPGPDTPQTNLTSGPPSSPSCMASGARDLSSAFFCFLLFFSANSFSLSPFLFCFAILPQTGHIGKSWEVRAWSVSLTGGHALATAETQQQSKEC
jgi:hypothetical protein